ncbi:uncharacterized protein BT62DRAFT_932220 [Guyanagaster necrorhizus]|uniref:Uncharacterized protein n=1 Tax=Guyanagaster necrorhizus TaxID=856835 RepID=A0A9P7VR23_9AGAR|nr:uncharacterized protein BT62DRAFT_932220 [Guyanagaster necrorhizus MCA 3950]KAG7445876.1 hypothetical protein BT62DRAFT_932220 [Guyanagaster necrorhizus MCA 3950]
MLKIIFRDSLTVKPKPTAYKDPYVGDHNLGSLEREYQGREAIQHVLYLLNPVSELNRLTVDALCNLQQMLWTKSRALQKKYKIETYETLRTRLDKDQDFRDAYNLAMLRMNEQGHKFTGDAADEFVLLCVKLFRINTARTIPSDSNQSIPLLDNNRSNSQ